MQEKGHFIVKVKYYSETTEQLSDREYTYYSAEHLNVGDIVTLPVRDTTGKAKVTAIDVPDAEIESFRDRVKTIPSGSIITVPKPPRDTKINLCDTCNLRGQFPTCMEDNIEFGDGRGNDNIIKCDNYEGSDSEPATETEEKPKDLFPAMSMEGKAIVKVDPGKAPSFAKHLEAAKHIVEIAASRQILTEADAKAANDDLNVMSELGKAVELERKSFTIPLNEHLAAINGAYKLITGPLQEADQITRRLLTAYKVEQQRKAAEAEKLNQDAIDLARRQAEAHDGEFTADMTPIPVPFAPKLTRTDQGKSGLVDNWKFRIVDLEKLPREYMVPDEAMLNSIAKKQHDKKQVPGVEFYNEPGLRVTR